MIQTREVRKRSHAEGRSDEEERVSDGQEFAGKGCHDLNRLQEAGQCPGQPPGLPVFVPRVHRWCLRWVVSRLPDRPTADDRKTETVRGNRFRVVPSSGSAHRSDFGPAILQGLKALIDLTSNGRHRKAFDKHL